MNYAQQEQMEFLDKLYAGKSISEKEYLRRKEAILRGESPTKDSNSSAQTVSITIAAILIVLYILIITMSDTSDNKDVRPAVSSITQPNSGVYKFTLTHGLGKELISNATFTCGNTPVWILDMNNGEKLEYTILSANENNLLCRIRARDNNGDNCQICIQPQDEGKVLITLSYGDLDMVYSGYKE